MTLKHLSNEDLHLQTLSLAKKERLTLIEILWHLRENERRMLYAEKGYRDLKEYCIKEMKYSEGSAWRRISAMRLLKDIPEVETQINLAQTAFRELKSTSSEKQEILSTLVNQTTRGTQRILAEKQPELFSKPEVTEKPLRGNRLEVTLLLDADLQKELDEIELMLGKKYSKLELLKLMTKEKLERLRLEKTKADKKRRAQPAPSDEGVATVASKSRRSSLPISRSADGTEV